MNSKKQSQWSRSMKRTFKVIFHLGDGGVRGCLVGHKETEADVREFITEQLKDGVLWDGCSTAEIRDIVITEEAA